MSKWILIWAMAFLATAGFGQESPAASKDQKKKAEKAAKKLQEQELSDRTVKLEDLITFPQRFTDRDLRVTNVRLTEVKPVRDGEIVAYLVAAEAYPGNARTYAMPTVEGVMFLTTEAIALEIQKRSGYRDYGLLGSGDVRPMADVWFRMLRFEENGRTLYAAKVNCVIFTGIKSTSVGACGN